MDIFAATEGYENWLRSLTPIDVDDFEYKHRRMADPHDPFPFFRATYYRWVQIWPKVCPDETKAPRALGVGDLHLENFGSWRDVEGRLCWGVNDFDEAELLPYTNDLVRLAASARVAEWGGHFTGKFSHICRAIFTGYQDALAQGGLPFVLEEEYPELRVLVMNSEHEPDKFWKKFRNKLAPPKLPPPPDVVDVLRRCLPGGVVAPEILSRPGAGLGSLGKLRFVAIARLAGSWVAREAKALTPPATASAGNAPSPVRSQAEVLRSAIRSPDPFYLVDTKWITRRLAPHCSRIEIGAIDTAVDVLRVFWAMGAETANVHLGSTDDVDAIRHDFRDRSHHWLAECARVAAETSLRDWQTWQKNAA